MKWLFLLYFSSIVLVGCTTTGGGGGGRGNSQRATPSESSTPVNQREAKMYKQAIIRCHKTGGSRIVKIKGKLRCF